MKTFLKHLKIQFLIDIRERGTLMVYYLVPLVFYLAMGAVFSSITPEAKETLGASMMIFGATMGAVLGMPSPIVHLREAGVLRAYKVSGIPGWAVLLIQAVSAFIHLLIVCGIIFFTAPLLFGASFPQNLPMFFLSLFVLLFASISLGLLIGVAAKGQSAVMMFSQAIFLPTVMLSGIMFPASMLPEPLRMVGRVLPGTYIMQAFTGFSFTQTPDIDPVISLLAAAGIGILAAALAVVKFRGVSKKM